MREKYRISDYTTSYGIDKRYLFFWYNPLCYSKIVWYKNDESAISYEILTFKDKKVAKREVEFLKTGGNPIKRRYFMNGKLISWHRD